MKKIVSVLLTMAILATMFSAVYALPGDLQSVSAELTQGSTAVQKVLGAIQWIGYAFAIGMLIYIGIKYTMSAANEKADLKKGLINFIIGAVIIAGAATICGWLASFGSELDN